MNEKRDTGAWLVAVSQNSTDEPALDPLEAMAELFSAVRAAGQIDSDRFEIHRKLAKIRPSDAREIIEIAEEQGYVQVTWPAEMPRTVATLEFQVNSNDAVPRYLSGSIRRRSRAVIEIPQRTLPMPKPQDALRNEMAGLNEETVKDALELAATLGLVSISDGNMAGSPLIFNP